MPKSYETVTKELAALLSGTAEVLSGDMMHLDVRRPDRVSVLRYTSFGGHRETTAADYIQDMSALGRVYACGSMTLQKDGTARSACSTGGADPWRPGTCLCPVGRRHGDTIPFAYTLPQPCGPGHWRHHGRVPLSGASGAGRPGLSGRRSRSGAGGDVPLAGDPGVDGPFGHDGGEIVKR